VPPRSTIRAAVISALGYAHFTAGHDDEAITAMNEALPLLAASKSPSLGAAELTLGRAQLHAKLPEATLTLRKALEDIEAAGESFPGAMKYRAVAQAAYGAALARNGGHVEGERLARSARASLLEGNNATSVVLADVNAYLADIISGRRQDVEVRLLRNEAIDLYRRIYGAGHPSEVALHADMDAAP
jgi:hypothetical protein